MTTQTTLRPHEVLREIIERIDTIPGNVYDEIASDNPRGFACSAALRHIRGVVMSIDRLDSRYDGSIGLLDPSKVAAGEGLDLGGDDDGQEDTEIVDTDTQDEKEAAEDETPPRPFFGNRSFLLSLQRNPNASTYPRSSTSRPLGKSILAGSSNK